MKTSVITVAGHICLDIIPRFPDQKSLSISELFTPGGLVQVGPVDLSGGGVVANTGQALRIFGEEVVLMGKIGADPFGHILNSILCRHGDHSGLIVDAQESTAYSVVVSPKGIDRFFIHHPGANDSFTLSDLDMDQIAASSIFHFGYPPLMKALWQNGGVGLVSLFDAVDSLGVVTSLDMCSLDPATEAGCLDWEDILKRTLAHVDFFVPSIEELAYMLNRPLYNRLTESEDSMSELSLSVDIQNLADKACSLGASNILIKCGAAGFYYRFSSMQKVAGKMGKDFSLWSGRCGFEKSYLPDQYVSGTGAGDTTIAAFLACCNRGYSLERTLSLASAAGALCVSSADALGSLTSLEDMEARIASGWKKQELLKA